MRRVLLLLFLVAQQTLAAECLRVVDSPSPQPVVLSGVVEYKPKPPSSFPNAFEIILKLATPICVQGVTRDGLPFKKENLDVILLGIPRDLMGALKPLDRVTLRGELRGPASNGEVMDEVMLAVREVL